MTEYGMDAGLEVRSPHADIRLIECVLRLPWRQREPRGHYRRTGRDALGSLLPDEFLHRVGQAPWTRVWQTTAMRALPGIASFIREGPWFSAPFVDRGIAKAKLQALVVGGFGSSFDEHFLVIQFGALEAWLRDLLG
jgi:hypothetical protein